MAAYPIQATATMAMPSPDTIYCISKLKFIARGKGGGKYQELWVMVLSQAAFGYELRMAWESNHAGGSLKRVCVKGAFLELLMQVVFYNGRRVALIKKKPTSKLLQVLPSCR